MVTDRTVATTMENNQPYADGNGFHQDEIIAEHLNSVLVLELSAKNAYNTALKHFNSKDDQKSLQELLNTHENNILFLRKKIFNKNQVPESESGLWGTVSGNMVKATSLASEDTLIGLIIKGEKYLISEYEDIINNKVINLEQKSIIKEELVEPLKRNIAQLKKISK